MGRSRNFIDREVFEEVLQGVATSGGGAYESAETVYGDMSRLVVGWLAATPPEELQRIYEAGGWKGPANVKPVQEAAKAWYAAHHPDRTPVK